MTPDPQFEITHGPDRFPLVGRLVEVDTRTVRHWGRYVNGEWGPTAAEQTMTLIMECAEDLTATVNDHVESGHTFVWRHEGGTSSRYLVQGWNWTRTLDRGTRTRRGMDRLTLECVMLAQEPSP